MFCDASVLEDMAEVRCGKFKDFFKISCDIGTLLCWVLSGRVPVGEVRRGSNLLLVTDRCECQDGSKNGASGIRSHGVHGALVSVSGCSDPRHDGSLVPSFNATILACSVGPKVSTRLPLNPRQLPREHCSSVYTVLVKFRCQSHIAASVHARNIDRLNVGAA